MRKFFKAGSVVPKNIVFCGNNSDQNLIKFEEDVFVVGKTMIPIKKLNGPIIKYHGGSYRRKSPNRIVQQLVMVNTKLWTDGFPLAVKR